MLFLFSFKLTAKLLLYSVLAVCLFSKAARSLLLLSRKVSRIIAIDFLIPIQNLILLVYYINMTNIKRNRINAFFNQIFLEKRLLLLIENYYSTFLLYTWVKFEIPTDLY